jgi:hypothetical protein
MTVNGILVSRQPIGLKLDPDGELSALQRPFRCREIR